MVQGVPTIQREVLDLNASLTFTFNDGPVKGLSVIAWGRNLLDAQYLTAAFPAVAQAGSLSGYPSQPRTYGLTALYRF